MWVLMGVGLSVPVWAQGPAIVVTPGEGRVFRVAVQVFRDDALPQDGARSGDLREEIEEAMVFSDVLQPLSHAAFLGSETSLGLVSGRRADCAQWTQGGADALVEGVIERRGQELAVRYQVWDTARCKRLTLGELVGPDANRLRLAKWLADDVVGALTGTPGVAGTEIAFISDRSGEREVYVMDADGGRQRKATRGQSIKAFPDWMPDGGAILYTSYQDQGIPGLYLSSRGAYTPGPILTRVLPGKPKYRGVFGPEGRFLAMVTSDDGATEIYRVDRSGRNPKRLTRNRSIDISPSWSPDGEQIAFVSDRSGSPQLYIMQSDGQGVRRLSFNGDYNTSPAWSPDGRWIAYETRISGQFDVWLIDPAGEVNVPLVTHPRNDESPSWSPDGRRVVFSSTRRGRADLYSVDLRGEKLRRLTKKQGDNLQPAWGPFASEISR
ncbi:MAG: hypothetical protein CL917_09235 [Deltaproteobacteria bacterium]|nr:hypothetical protein [Deltaproteobacteria bacterium]